MNEKKIIKYILMKIITKADDGICILNRPNINDGDRQAVKVCFKDIDYLARMLIEE